jgi:hypothetical protein
MCHVSRGTRTWWGIVIALALTIAWWQGGFEYAATLVLGSLIWLARLVILLWSSDGSGPSSGFFGGGRRRWRKDER